MKLRAGLIAAGLVIGLFCNVFAEDSASRFFTGVEAYKSGQYETAITHFQDLARSGLTSAGLYYNLASAYLKNGELGSAILWYERALQLSPDDPVLKFNLTYARSLTKDAAQIDDNTLVRIVFFWKYQFSDRTLRMLALAANLIFWTTAAMWYIARRNVLKSVMWSALAAALILMATTAFNAYEKGHSRPAIVLPERIAVRAGLESGATMLFELHAGAKVRILRELKDHCQIRFAEDKMGWVEKSMIGTIW